jgi:TPP-dependent pyruvate/acetoin dehydrogenase alpha subunit
MATKLFQILKPDPTAQPVAVPPNMETQRLIQLYEGMVRLRAYDEKGFLLTRAGRVAIYYGATGEEACVIGTVAALAEQDWVFPYYREAGVFQQRGMPLTDMFSQLFANRGDRGLGHQSPIHYTYSPGHVVSVSSPIGTQISQAVGAAMAINIQKDPAKPVVLTYMGDGATSSNDFHAGMTFAGVYRPPVILVCKNNQWAISMPVRQQSGTQDMADKAPGYGIPGVVVDGNDVLAVYHATRLAVEKARNGEGPTFLELKTYRMGPHSTPDDPKRYRSEEEIAPWRERDPIVRYRQFLEDNHLWDAKKEEQLWGSVREEINQAVRQAEVAGPLPWESMFEAVYSSPPPALQAQQEALGQELSAGITPDDLPSSVQIPQKSDVPPA